MASNTHSSFRDGKAAVHCTASEKQRARGYPLSRWYVRPAAAAFARLLTKTWIRPNDLSICGIILTVAAILIIILTAEMLWIAGLFVLGAWFFDRADGLLARMQGTASRWGAWLDANLDELSDVALHAAIALASARALQSELAGAILFSVFISGKYLFMYGLLLEDLQKHDHTLAPAATSPDRDPDTGAAEAPPDKRRTGLAAVTAYLYHLPANADIRVHVLVVALLLHLPVAELVLVGAYYHFRWVARYALTRRRLRRKDCV
jgi:phosphatidylglycerophosphate synthase